MIPEILQPLTVFIAFGVVLVVPTWISAARLNRSGGVAGTLLAAVILGCASQGILGMLWNDFVRADPRWEVLAYFSGWLFVSLLPLSGVSRRRETEIRDTQGERWLLLILICASFLVRSIHPLQHPALGQSDAYSHLQFLRNAVESGFIGNYIYPPGYHWVLMLPVFPFHLDPYDIARFGGAFFGSGLVLAVFVLAKDIGGTAAAVLAGFFVACFPGFNLLIKTGVGAFANQLGLLYVPVVYGLFARAMADSFRNGSVHLLLCVALAGLAITVPIMLVSVVMVFASVMVWIWRRDGFGRSLLTPFLLLLPAFGILSLHVAHTGWLHQKQTIATMTEASLSRNTPREAQKNPDADAGGRAGRGREAMRAFVTLATDYLAVKRWGFPENTFNAAGLLLFGLFVWCLVRGAAESRAAFVVLGAWGAWATLQTLTGFAQFSSYQREGWGAMTAAATGLGILGSGWYRRGRKPLWQAFFGVSFLVSVVWAVTHPPGHSLWASVAEDRIVEVARALSAYHARGNIGAIASPDAGIRRLAATLDGTGRTVFVSRRITGWKESGQGELIRSVVGPKKDLDIVTIDTREDLKKLAGNDTRYVFFLDREAPERHDPIAFANISPVQTERFLKQRKELQANNRILEAFLKEADPGVWCTDVVSFDEGLDVYVMRRKVRDV